MAWHWLARLVLSSGATTSPSLSWTHCHSHIPLEQVEHIYGVKGHATKQWFHIKSHIVNDYRSGLAQWSVRNEKRRTKLSVKPRSQGSWVPRRLHGPFARRSNPFAKVVWPQLLKIWDSGIPYVLTNSVFLTSDDTVAKTVAPMCCASITAACPTPPAAQRDWRDRVYADLLCSDAINREAANVPS